ncbi:MAG: DUF1566 domain-containing protein [Candidatus Marinimicrobia bacterium]|nr:DUF1566 domain-containing protein [Candidatus Neomarinimicrobiota bacterium]MDP7336519.1 DUF1566 domain-containing protein [Candidatus Neomarinimicrobiota bacterium]
MKRKIYQIYFTLFALCIGAIHSQTYKVVDTGQEKFYNNTEEITPPSPGEDFYGQDAHFDGYQPSYSDNGDGTVTDLNTGLMWQKAVSDKMTFDEALAGADTFSLADYDDWRLPTIKELYSLILFSGVDPSGWQGSDTDLLTPFIDAAIFEFEYGDESAGERIIDAQYWSSTIYVSTTMNGDETAFGVNFADGRIKGYPAEPVGPPGQEFIMTSFVKYVRGSEYGVNDFIDNGAGTITDQATGLMWTQDDSETGLNWEEALSWVAQKNTDSYLGYDDWRLPNAKELQSIVDYTRSPETTNSAAIDPLFTCSVITDEDGEDNYPFYWTGTTHANMQVNGKYAVYVSFGEALGWMEMPPNSGNFQLLDVHGAGAQRSDPKSGDPGDWPYGHGPQGDVIRIYNYVRLVRDIQSTSTLEFQSDWNLVGLPIEVQDSYYLSIFPDAIEGTLYSFNGGYISESYLTSGEGYWLRFANDGSTTIDGIPINELTVNLNEGWNLITGGSTSLNILDIQDPDGIIISGTVYGFISGGYVNAEIIEPGKGYWVRANSSGSITLIEN